MAVDGATAKAIAGSVWLNQGKFEVAEAMAQETIAKEHSGLKIEVFYGVVLAACIISQLF